MEPPPVPQYRWHRALIATELADRLSGYANPHLSPPANPADWREALCRAEELISAWNREGVRYSIPQPARATPFNLLGECYRSAHEAAISCLCHLIGECIKHLAGYHSEHGTQPPYQDGEGNAGWWGMPSDWPADLFTAEAVQRVAEHFPRVPPDEIERIRIELETERDRWAVAALNQPATPPSPATPEQISPVARAIAFMVEARRKGRPVPSTKKLADMVGCDRSTLDRDRYYKSARKVALGIV